MSKKSFGKRLSAANASVDRALEAFDQAARTLADAASEAADVVSEVEAEVVRLRAVRDDAYRQQVSYTARAEKIREFLA